jgi:hypothetical protein
MQYKLHRAAYATIVQGNITYKAARTNWSSCWFIYAFDIVTSGLLNLLLHTDLDAQSSLWPVMAKLPDSFICGEESSQFTTQVCGLIIV